jgi:transcription initiation factor TFIID subunit 1
MQAGLYRLKHLGITETHPNSISSAMSRLPDEAIALAAASHIERELQITPWNLSSNFVACTSQVIYVCLLVMCSKFLNICFFFSSFFLW